MHKGIYYVSADTPERGSQVELCLEGEFAGLALEREYLRFGRCDNGIMPLVKTLAGLPGDEIAIDQNGIYVNGTLWPSSAIRALDSKGRQMPAQLLTGVIPMGKALVLSAHAGGFDGRYFGLVELHRLRKVEPLILF
ncbi:MAG: S26 family signal peptidase, partial [Desulfovibrionaceae bacterium]|nr:S26 family signal peptidase [Desulfovibrionaceae bacterium]